MESLQSKDGQLFIRGLANFIRQHEKALANSLQLMVQRRQPTSSSTGTPVSPNSSRATNTSTLAAALSFAGLNFRSHNINSKNLSLTPHHLFYLLSRIEELDIDIGPMNVRIESIHSEMTPSNYVSFLQTRKPQRGRSDSDSIHSVSSVRSVMSGMSSFWSNIGLASTTAKSEKAKQVAESDLKYIYAAFTKVPTLRLTPNHQIHLIKGFEEFPFDTAVPLFAFKNLQQLEIVDLDFRQFYGWDRLADNICLLTVRRANLDDPADLLTNIVLDDAEKRRRRSTKGGYDAPSTPSWSVPSTPRASYAQSDDGSPPDAAPSNSPLVRANTMDEDHAQMFSKRISSHSLSGSISPKRPSNPRPTSSYRHVRTYSSKPRRQGSGSSHSSDCSMQPQRNDGTMHNANMLPSSKWQRLVYLSLADNSLTSLSGRSLAPLTSSLKFFNLSSNLFTEIPDGLSSLTRLVSLDLSHCMISSVQSLAKYPLPAITTIKLKANRLQSLKGLERLLSLENLHVQENLITDPMEAARLENLPNLRKICVKRNPFTRSFSDYRIRMMNIFRRVPGRLEDIILDDQPASAAEKRQLIDRVPDLEAPPVIPVNKFADPPLVVQQPNLLRFSVSNPFPPPSTAQQQHEVVSNTGRRKKTARRRIVDLSQEEELRVASRALEPVTAVKLPSPQSKSDGDPTLLPSPQLIEYASKPDDLDEVEAVRRETSPEINADLSNDYKDRIEALRQQFGSNWLSALGEQPWHNENTYIPISSQAPAIIHHNTSPPIITGGRNLG